MRRANDTVHSSIICKLCQPYGLLGSITLNPDIHKRGVGRNFCLVTPGIRPAGTHLNDQRRVATPGDALRYGSDYLVIGRPITQAQDPLKALRDIEIEINAELQCASK